MGKRETLQGFYNEKEWLPENLRRDIGHFNVFRLEPFVGKDARPVPYRRRDYYKIILAHGNSEVNYADRTFKANKQSLGFTNPQVPFSSDSRESVHGGCFCIFNQTFFRQFGNLSQYAVFQPGGIPLFELSDDQTNRVSLIFDRMFEEIKSDYLHKYDLLRMLVFELIHLALKMQPAACFEAQAANASQRISMLFMELLERQFPIDDIYQSVKLRTAADFAGQLNVHVNHLNHAIKETTGKTTTQLISERILQEAKILVKHTTWAISEVSYALGFSEATHFNNFFKKHTQLSPLKYRII